MEMGNVQIAVLQKMGLITSDTLVEIPRPTQLIAAMPPPANRGLQLLSTAGKFITKSIEITQQSLQEMNILPSPLYMMNIYQHQNDDIPPYTAIGGEIVLL